MPEIYISTDIETDGPIPGPNSIRKNRIMLFSVRKGLSSFQVVFGKVL